MKTTARADDPPTEAERGTRRSTSTARHSIGSMLYFLTALTLGCYFTFAAVQEDYGVLRQVEISVEADALKLERDCLAAELAEIKNWTKRLPDTYLDVDLLDEQAREVLGYVRADEIVIRYTNSGAGNNRAEQISGSLQSNEMATAGIFTLRNRDGRACTGNFQFDASDVNTFPISCSDGTTSTAMSTINRFNSQQTISYKLISGESGSILLGNP